MVYNTFSDYLKTRYGEKVYKLPVGLPVTCPNRDGTCGSGGCTFCGAIGAGYENLPADMTVTEQLAANRAHIIPKYKHLILQCTLPSAPDRQGLHDCASSGRGTYSYEFFFAHAAGISCHSSLGFPPSPRSPAASPKHDEVHL